MSAFSFTSGVVAVRYQNIPEKRTVGRRKVRTVFFGSVSGVVA